MGPSSNSNAEDPPYLAADTIIAMWRALPQPEGAPLMVLHTKHLTGANGYVIEINLAGLGRKPRPAAVLLCSDEALARYTANGLEITGRDGPYLTTTLRWVFPPKPKPRGNRYGPYGIDITES